MIIPEADVEADDLDFNSYVVTRSSHMPKLKWLKGQVPEYTRDKWQGTLKAMKAVYSSTRCDLRSALGHWLATKLVVQDNK
jgi:hypothetical protein